MPAKGLITRIRIRDPATGTVYADGLEFDITAPPPATLEWGITIKNVGDEEGDIFFHFYQIEPYPHDVEDWSLLYAVGQERTTSSLWIYPPLEPLVRWRVSVEREVNGQRVIDDAYVITITHEKISSTREVGVPPVWMILPASLPVLIMALIIGLSEASKSWL